MNLPLKDRKAILKKLPAPALVLGCIVLSRRIYDNCIRLLQVLTELKRRVRKKIQEDLDRINQRE